LSAVVGYGFGIAEQNTIIVRRPNAQDLLKIQRGEIDLERFMEKAEADILRLNSYFEKSHLHDDVDKDFVNELLLEVRHKVAEAQRHKEV